MAGGIHWECDGWLVGGLKQRKQVIYDLLVSEQAHLKKQQLLMQARPLVFGHASKTRAGQG